MSFAAVSDSGRDGAAFAVSIGASLLLHAGIVVALLSLRPAAPPSLPPIYRVNIIAAAPGPPAGPRSRTSGPSWPR